LKKFKSDDFWKKQSIELPRDLSHISLANASDDELEHYVQSFRHAGITLPVIYPYFPMDENSDFKQKTMKRILDLF
jgi:hypothetical protein